MNRIIFTGAQGTGKTTLLKACEEKGARIITEVVRNLAKTGVKINEDGDEKGQKRIFKEYEKLLSDPQPYISDRGLTDVLAYSIYLRDCGKVSDKLVETQFKSLKKFIKNNPDIIFCYFPIEFDVVEDGIRSQDEKFRQAIDNNIRELLDTLGVTYVTVRGDKEIRIKTIDKLHLWLKYGIELYSESFTNKNKSAE